MVFVHEVRLKEGWFNHMFKKLLNAVSPVASIVNKSGPVASLLGMKKKGSTGTKGGFGNMAASLARDPKFKTALEEGKARVAPKKMSTGGSPTKKKKKNTKVSKSECSRRADGCAVKGKTRGRIV